MDLSSPALGLDGARLVEPARYALGGAMPRHAVRPADADEVGAVLSAADRGGQALVPWGGGLGLAHMPAPARYDVALDLSALDRVLAYEPADLTITAECGVTLATLAVRLGERGQELPIEAAHPERATLGGALAANAVGPRRLRFGSPRDRILGARMALADGTLARTGGRVVKNVAGHGVHRMLCGSHGALGVLLEVTLKLLPAAATHQALRWQVSAAAIADATRWASLPRLEPAWWTVLGPGSSRNDGRTPGREWSVLVGFEDDAPWVARQVEIAIAVLGEPKQRLMGGDAIASRLAITDLGAPASIPWLSFTSAHNSPAALAPLLGEPDARSLVFDACSGHLGLALEPAGAGGATGADRARLERLVAVAAAAGFTLDEAIGIDPPDAPRPSGVLALRRRIRDALDPRGTFAYGARWSG